MSEQMQRRDGPGFWMRETSGVLRPAVEAYLSNAPMTAFQIAGMRAYLRQWIEADCWNGPEIDALRRGINSLLDRRSIAAWLDRAEEAGIDPL